MTSEKAGLIRACIHVSFNWCVYTGVILCENNTIDWCIIGFQVLMILVQILITVFDIRKTIKTNK